MTGDAAKKESPPRTPVIIGCTKSTMEVDPYVVALNTTGGMPVI